MSQASFHTPQWYREEAERCFRLAENVSDQKASADLMNYGRELLARAERMEAVLSLATAAETLSGLPSDQEEEEAATVPRAPLHR
jgi:hypothetical protein